MPAVHTKGATKSKAIIVKVRDAFYDYCKDYDDDEERFKILFSDSVPSLLLARYLSPEAVKTLHRHAFKWPRKKDKGGDNSRDTR